MIKKVLAFVLLVVATVSYGQENTASPYSYYGLGELRFKGTIDARSIGGIGVERDSISLNLLNPASYSRLRLTNFSVGGSSTFYNLKNQTSEEKAKRSSVEYLAVGIPMGKFGATLGVLPYSAVGYNIFTSESTTDSNNNTVERSKIYKGQGNVNLFRTGIAYNIDSKWSVGFDLNYNFGNIEKSVNETISGITLGTRELNESKVSGFSLGTGVMYENKINDKLKISSSFTFNPEAKLTSKNYRNVATVNYSLSGQELVDENEDVIVPDSKMLIPSKIGFGVGVGEKTKWFMGSEVSFIGTSKWNKLMENANNPNAITYKNGTRIGVGGYYIPDFNSYSSYFKRIVYRAGFRYENTGLIVNNTEINDYGMNFGLGLPLSYSKINVGFEFGKRGTTENNLIQENYFNLSVGLSLSDKWFKRRKID